MNKILHELLAGIKPVLMEVGATDRSEEIWDAIAPWSVYFGVGSSLQTDNAALMRYHHRFLFKEIVVPDDDTGLTTFYRTRDPIYSIILPPDASVIAEYSDLVDVRVVETLTMPTTSISNLLAHSSVSQVDWIKTNVNGVDARLIGSLTPVVRDRVLAVDTVLDYVPLCLDQDNTLCHHQDLLGQGFWLSRLTNCGAVRMRGESVMELQRRGIGDPVGLTAKYHRSSPAWAFGRYFRTVNIMERLPFNQRDFLVLWCFALLDGQLGFCADLALGYERKFGRDDKSEAMLRTVTMRLKELLPRRPSIVRRAVRRLLPSKARRILKVWAFGR